MCDVWCWGKTDKQKNNERGRFFKESALGRFFHRVAMSATLSVCLFVPFHVVYFEAYFAHTSRSRMSKHFRDSESLGKSAGKKWSQN